MLPSPTFTALHALPWDVESISVRVRAAPWFLFLSGLYFQQGKQVWRRHRGSKLVGFPYGSQQSQMNLGHRRLPWLVLTKGPVHLGVGAWNSGATTATIILPRAFFSLFLLFAGHLPPHLLPPTQPPFTPLPRPKAPDGQELSPVESILKECDMKMMHDGWRYLHGRMHLSETPWASY